MSSEVFLFLVVSALCAKVGITCPGTCFTGPFCRFLCFDFVVVFESWALSDALRFTGAFLLASFSAIDFSEAALRVGGFVSAFLALNASFQD